VYLIAVVLLLKEMTQSAVVLGLFQILAILPTVLLGAFLGVIVDMVSRKRLVVVTDLLRGAIMLVLWVLTLAPGPLTPATVLAATFLIGICNALFFPAVQALTPFLVPSSRVKRANAARVAGNQVTNLTGSAVGGIIYVALGMPFIFLANGISFIVSGVSEMFIRSSGAATAPGSAPAAVSDAATAPAAGTNAGAPRAPAEPAPTAPAAGDADGARLRGAGGSALVRRILRDVREGIRFVFAERGLRTLLFANAAVLLLSPPLILVMPFLVEDYLRLPEAFVGYFLATMLAGGIASYVAIGAARQGGRVDRFTFVVSFLVLAVAIFVAGRWTVPPVLFPALFVAGGCIGASNLIVTSTVQRVVEPERHGRVFALLEALSSVSAPISYAVSGVLIDFVMADLSGVFLAVSAAILVLFVAVALNGELGRYIERKNAAYYTHERS
jgi:MFS family permease